MFTLGIDPGLRVTGLALYDGRAVVSTHSIRGVQGARDDYPRVTAAAHRIATDVAAFVDEMDPTVIAVETFVDQGPGRNRLRYRWQTPVVIGALVMALHPWADRIRWQDAGDVLRMDTRGYGTVKYLAEQGRLPGLAGAVNEHEAAAVAHAMWADAVERQTALFA